MNSLKRQVAKARRYQALAADVRVLDTHLGHRRFTELSGQRAELAVSMRSLEAREAELERQLPAKEERVAQARTAARVFEGELAELRQRLNEHRNAYNSATAGIAFNEERKQDLESRIRQNHEEIYTIRGKLAEQEHEVNAATEALDHLTRRIAEQELQLAEQESRTRAVRAEREQLENALRENRGEATRCQTLIASMQAKIESALAQLEGTRDRARQLADEEQRLTLELEEFRAEQSRIAGEVETTAAQLVALEETFQTANRGYQHTRGDLDASRAAATEAHKTLAQRGARLDAVRQLVESGEGFAQGTRQVLTGLDEPERFLPAVRGALAALIEAENSCARAIEAALGRHLQAVLVADDGLATALIDRLTEKQLGLATILPENFLPHPYGTQMEAVPDGATAWALDRVKADQRVAGFVGKLLERTLLVPDLATALRLRPSHPGVTFATLTGQLLEAAGAISGGSAAEAGTSVLERANEVRALQAEVAALIEADAAATTRVAELEARLEEAREEVEVCRERLQRGKVDLSTLQGQLGLATREVENFETKLENVRWERGELAKREQAAADSRQHLESELAAARERLEALETATRRLQSEADSAARNEQNLAETLNEMRTMLAVERRAKQAAEEQQKPREARLAELREISIRREAEISSYTQRIEEAAANSARLAEECETHRAQAEELQAEIDTRSEGRSALIDAIEEAEIELAAVRREHLKVSEQKGREEVAATKLDLLIENLLTNAQERHQTDLTVFEPDAHALLASIANQKKLQARSGRQIIIPGETQPAFGGESDEHHDEEDMPVIVVDATKEDDAEEPDLPPDMSGEPDWAFVEAIVSDLKRRLDAMGPVNLDAIEEYEELEERHVFLRGQHDDLVASKTELLAVIERINTETQRLFADTFEQVRVNFQAMFKELFGAKGEADLKLQDAGDLLETGIEISAKPPGKKLQSISLLSGGERSMTAVALLFSIYMIKPSPFCVLDELDAPLDESNIGRFVRVLDRFIDRSQFIIVTHSKRTMARVDVMYGVTMEEFGVSKPVGMRLTQSEPGGEDDDATRSAARNAASRLNGEVPEDTVAAGT